MIQVQVDEAAVREMYAEAIESKLKKYESDLVFWDSKELQRRTSMSWNTIQDTFFHDPNFQKVKIGGKWYYPGKEAEKFLLNWLRNLQ